MPNGILMPDWARTSSLHSLWTYNPRNNDEVGDAWNHENFSWYSEEKRQDLLYARFLRMGRPNEDQLAAQASDLDIGARMLDEIVVSCPAAIICCENRVDSRYSSATIPITNSRDTPFPALRPRHDHNEIRIRKSDDPCARSIVRLDKRATPHRSPSDDLQPDRDFLASQIRTGMARSHHHSAFRNRALGRQLESGPGSSSADLDPRELRSGCQAFDTVEDQTARRCWARLEGNHRLYLIGFACCDRGVPLECTFVIILENASRCMHVSVNLAKEHETYLREEPTRTLQANLRNRLDRMTC